MALPVDDKPSAEDDPLLAALHPPAARRRPQIHPDADKFRILWVAASAQSGGRECLALARALDPQRYLLHYFPCAKEEAANAPQTAGDAMATRADAGADPTAAALPMIDQLHAAGVRVETRALHRDFARTVLLLRQALCGADVVISEQDVADIYPALDGMHWRPPLIERGMNVAEACAGPKHHTFLYLAATPAARLAAAGRMGERAAAARHVGFGDVAGILEAVTEARKRCRPAPAPHILHSSLMGGWESATHRLRDGRRLDVIAATGHDRLAARDYAAMRAIGLQTCRDALRWHLIDRGGRHFDFASFTPMLHAARAQGVQVIWDLMHYGFPDDLDIWSPAFVDRFAAFARAAALHHRHESDDPPLWCPINEISFMAWAAGDVGYMHPFAEGRGFELKVQLARAAIAAITALREVDARARILTAEPLIAVHPDPTGALPPEAAEEREAAQFQTLDLITGRLWPQIGGREDLLDMVGVNYYVNNQWIHEGRFLDLDDAAYRPLSDLLAMVAARYDRPLLISETGIEGPRRAAWLGYILKEVARARRRGIGVEGICLYPVANHPGWDDDRPCPNGLFGMADADGSRGIHADLARVLRAAVEEANLDHSTGC